MEQGLYTKILNLSREDLEFISANQNKNEAKFKFQGQYSRSQCWFDLDFDFIGVNFSTPEPDLHNRTFQIHSDTQDTNTFKIFQVPIGNSKCVENFKFHNDAPMLKYCQKLLNSYYFSCLASSFTRIEQTKSDNTI